MSNRACLLLGLLLAAPIDAAEVRRVEVSERNGLYSIDAEILVAASMGQVFDVLTDFENLAGLSSAIRESRVEQKIDDTEQLVYTQVKGCVLFFCRTVQRVERVKTHYPCELSADLVDGKGDLKASRSYWRLSPSGDGTRLYFSTHVEPLFWVPASIGESVIKRMVMQSVLDSMEAAERRAAQQPASGGG